jgi:tetratricopeptide (TPR) repeat protein
VRSYSRLRFTQTVILLALPLSVLGASVLVPLTIDSAATAPVIDGYGATTLVPSQANEPARHLFAQGMAQAYAFNEDEAVRAFKAALARDPDCGMCAWGVALQMGPNINRTKRGDVTEARKYIDYALAHSEGASARDLALIQSLALRYGHSAARAIAPPPGAMCGTGSTEPADPLDLAYADYMQQLALRFSGDPDVLTLYAEAEMVVTKGDWWDRVTGKPAGRIGELARMLEAGLARHPDHVGLNHYMIHAVGVAAQARRGEVAADRLGNLAPRSPHLLHMPSHIYAALGRYTDAARVNQLAVAADETLLVDLKKQGFEQTKDWRRHNGEFLVYAALMEGRGDAAMAAAHKLATLVSGDHVYGEFMRSVPMLTLLNLQRWDDLLAEPLPKGDKGMAMVLSEMARGIAMARLGQLEDARAAYGKLNLKAEALLEKYPGNDGEAKIVQSLVKGAQARLGAELAFASRRVGEAIALQTEAVATSLYLENLEPPMLANGPRQRLAAMQIRAHRYADAELTLRDELARHPGNGWAYKGLETVLKKQGKTAEAQTARQNMLASWPNADKALLAVRY